jgi:acyl-CoA thioesterase-1
VQAAVSTAGLAGSSPPGGGLARCVSLYTVAVAAIAAGLFLGSGPISAEPIDKACSVPPELSRFSEPLNASRRALARGTRFRIVALGSSSTEGTGASNPRTCYPAQLETELNRRFSRAGHIEVVNLGVGGHLATDMIARIDAEVASRSPTLVIWQTGVNDAIAGVPLDDFRMQLAQGIDAIRATGADLILLDLQYYPRSERVRGYRSYLQAMWQVGREKGVPVLKRHTYMKHLLDSRRYTAAQILAPDLFHLNDLSYRCLGHMVANAIESGVVAAEAAGQERPTAVAAH